MTGLDKIREVLCQSLTDAGLCAVTAWSGEEKKRYDGAVVAVSLRGCEGGPGGFRDYLGERYNEETQRWEELYGRKAKVTFGLDIYSAGKDGGGECQSTFDRMADALQGAVGSGLRLESLSRGETGYDKDLGLFHCPVEGVCGAYLYAVTDEGGMFVDFEVRGEGKG